MSIPTFTLGYPPDGSSLGNTKSTIRDNLDGSFEVFGIDHQTQNTIFPGAAGSHTKVSLKNTTNTSTPTLPPGIFGVGYETLYSQPAGSAPLGPLGEVFYSRAGNAGVQLTGPGTPTPIVNNGYTFLAGGIVLQWGLFPSPVSGNNPITFNPTFPTACLNVSISIVRTAANIEAMVILVGSVTQSGFTVIAPTGGSAGIFWTAIGY